jgi:hypothetical protein
MDNGVYDVLMWVAQIVLPAFATLYFTISSIWGLPMVEQIVATIMALDGLLGAILGLSTRQFNKKASFAAVVE